jgi:predicted RNA binding protein YcfA (HicA-like mRNA interferase family)
LGLSINGPEMKRVLERCGWRVKRETAHWQMSHDDFPGKVISIPRHRDDLVIKTLKSILKEANLTEDDVRRLK